jgi:membrane associated rhomboid family serine protease
MNFNNYRPYNNSPMMGQQLTPLVQNLLILNIAMLGIKTFLTSLDLDLYLGLFSFQSSQFRVWQIVTHMFMHADFGHLFSNMLGLFFFGPILERLWGSQRFAIYYVLCALGAMLLHQAVNIYESQKLLHDIEIYKSYPSAEAFKGFVTKHIGMENLNYDWIQTLDQLKGNTNEFKNQTITLLQSFYSQRMDIPMVGASGAIFGILFAFGFLFPNTEMYMMFIPMPIKAKYMIIFYALYELFNGVKRIPGDNVAHFAHLGGMLVGYIILRIWQQNKTKFY